MTQLKIYIMYILDDKNNKIKKAQLCSFKELGLEERKNLQEWIANEPSSLGEDLLIIQKEFDGFSDTKERLDLLALDKQGNLVIIENKLDDSGRDVTWQAIKYASYCSSLSKQQIIDIYQKYIGSTGNAVEQLNDFFDVDDIAELEINKDNSQRIFFVAANFRKEVTSSVLWLANFGLNIKCFKVTPFKYGEKILVDFDQIIPIKEAEDYTIKMATKKQEDSQDSATVELRKKQRQNFWSEFIEYSKQYNGIYAASLGTTDSWLGKSVGVSGINVNVIIGLQKCRTEIYFNLGDAERNKEAFDFFCKHKDNINSLLPDYQVKWERMDGKVTCRIRADRDLQFTSDEDKIAIFDFLNASSANFFDVFSKYAKKLPKA